MWLVTTRGFYSVVEDTTDPEKHDRLLIRARVRADLEALRDLLPGLEILETPDSDYHFRASTTKPVFAGIAFHLVTEINYPNFKNTIAERAGYERAHVYGSVWRDLLELRTPAG